MAAALLTLLSAVAVVLVSVPLSSSLPFIVLHGIADQCANRGVAQFTELLSNWSGSPGYCLKYPQQHFKVTAFEVADTSLKFYLKRYSLAKLEMGHGIPGSYHLKNRLVVLKVFTCGPCWRDDVSNLYIALQTNTACDKVREMKELSGGYNIVGLSQGNLIGRGIVEFCDGAPPAKNFISLDGPHAGIASVPLCGSGIMCIIADALIKGEIYSNYVQSHLAPSGYLKIPTDIPDYLKGCRFLPKLNNELPNERNSTYKERFSRLQNLVLIMSENDKVLVPPETSWFGYYPDGAFDPVLPPQQTTLYKEDWIGLRALDEAGRVKYIGVPGGHLGISQSDMKKYMVPYLKDGTLAEPIQKSSHLLRLPHWSV